MQKMNEEEYKAYILKYFSYADGIITRSDRPGGNGSLDKYGYLILKVKGRQFKAHRIAWLLYYGDFPKSELDHINRNRTDNRIENLRESNREQQIRNRYVPPNKETGVRGVHIDHYTKGLKKKYTTRVKGKAYRFYTLNEAVEFRKRSGVWV